MKRITEKYDTHSKDELVAEARARKIDSVNASSNKGDIVAALELDDEGSKGGDADKGNADSERQALTGHDTPIIRSNPVEPPPAKNEVNVTQPDVKDYKGAYVKNDDGEEYGLCEVPSDPLGKTHKLRNEAHFWEGTKDEFKAQFEKK